ncbi:MAG: PD-(D/E)XK nuclease family protein [Sulfurovum sp.]|nr:PD-(D/E)XK nuclease family protein [Sulfurovum sp.]
MNTLHIYPTARVLRSIRKGYALEDGFHPTLMRMDAFEQRAVILKNSLQIDPLQRILLLRKSAHFSQFSLLKMDLSLVQFFTKSDALFKFFEELATENVTFEQLGEADAYAEFSQHLDILQQLLRNYTELLHSKGMTDKVLMPQGYRLNIGFLQDYEEIRIHIEGYLSHFELSLLDEISAVVPLLIHYTTSTFNIKMQERFEAIGMPLPNDAHVVFSLSDKKILESVSNTATIEAKVYGVEERDEQIAVAFAEIETMVASGLSPDEIVLILPDETFKEHFSLFDQHHNLNFAMGYDYSKGYLYKSLDAVYVHWQVRDSASGVLLERYGVDKEQIEGISASKVLGVEDFFLLLVQWGLHKTPLLGTVSQEKFDERVYEAYIHFVKVLAKEKLSVKEWLFLWLKSLSTVTHDDVRGGKITVMGVLETRGVHFKGVVIVDFNEGIVPASSSKDQFLNSSVRMFANLPTKADREALQKQYYKRLLEESQTAIILYCTADNTLPSKFLYELGVPKAQASKAQFDLLYAQPSQLLSIIEDPIVEGFNAYDITWSASRLKTYLECKRKYYYRYIQKIQAQKESELNEGAFLHSLLDHLHREHDSYASIEAMQKNLDMLLDSLLPYSSSKIDYQKLLWKAKLKGYVASQVAYFKTDWKVVEREKEFQGEIGGLRFKGRVDRIDQNSTHTLLIDYKSGSTKEAQKTKNLETLTDLQMSIYHQLLSPKYSNLNLAFVKIFEKGEIEEITLLEEKNAYLAEHIMALKETESFVASRCETLSQCQWCEFTLLCDRGEYL